MISLTLFAILVFALILSFLIIIHEFGHFFTARKFGVDVPEFGLGIPPRIWGKKFGKTLYSINWLPLGGFVRIKGQDYEGYDPKDQTNFMNKKPWKRTVVLLAGIFMNVMLAFVIFYFVLGINNFKSNPILLIDDYTFHYGETIELPNVITFIRADSPAHESGIQFADRVVKLEYEADYVIPQSVDDIHDFLSDKDQKAIMVTTENINTGDVNTYVITPEYNEEIDNPAMGVALGEAVQISYQNPIDTVLAGPLHSANIMAYSFFALKSMVGYSIETKDVGGLSQGISGPVGIFGAVKAVMESGGPNMWIVLLDLTALLSLSLAIMNLLPIPALDGGRVVFVLYEWVTGKRPSPRIEERVHQIGYIFLIGLLLLITFKDVFSLF